MGALSHLYGQWARIATWHDKETKEKKIFHASGGSPSGTWIAMDRLPVAENSVLPPPQWTVPRTNLVSPCHHAFARNAQRKFSNMVFAAS
jgi:hypothetical protein